MEKYKRFTDKKATTENTKVVYNENGFAMFHKELVEALLEEHNRLWELENKIENGTLVIANKPFVVLDYISNGQEYYAIKVAEERDLAINLTKAEAEKKLKELQDEKK